MVRCIPVMIADDIECPYENEIDYSENSLKIRENDVDNIVEILLERKQYFAKRQAIVKYPKQQFVDHEKFERGHCLHCGLEVTNENVVAFHFDHMDETTKMIGKDTLAGETGGVAGLVQNTLQKGSFEHIKDTLVAEMKKCRLLCSNCHHRKTHYRLEV